MSGKVAPYPIQAQVKTADSAGSGLIRMLANHGCLVEMANSKLQPGDMLEIEFNTPHFGKHVHASAKVVKVHSQLANHYRVAHPDAPVPAPPPAGTGSSGQGLAHLVEIHFLNLTPESTSRIREFVKAAQKGSGH